MPLPKPPDAVSPSRQHRQKHALALLVAVSALAAGATANLVDDPRPLDVQLSGALRDAGRTLTAWQGQLAHGLQVSMRAVADGRERPPPAREPAASNPAAALAAVQ